ncbi:response regulator transcription factor [Alkalicoccobacillus gibsonii]|uniref:response regulator transcription factor n=1 Tax=Alkalicoccobacillus gibsonii TaxID=79881 RepID=UPI003519BD81
MYTLLLVDDEEATLLGLSAINWTDLGITTIMLASSVSEALDHLDSNTVHVVITDIRMPGQSGIDLLIEMNKRQYSTRGILLSGHAEFDYAKQAIRVHAVDYLLKPCSDEELMNAVEGVLKDLKEEERAYEERQSMLSELSKKPIFIGEILLRNWKVNNTEVKHIQRQIDEYQLPLKIDSQCYWVGVYNEQLKEGTLIEHEVQSELSSIGFPIMLMEEACTVTILLIVQNHEPSNNNKEFLNHQIIKLKQRLFMKFKTTTVVDTTDCFTFWPNVMERLNEVKQSIEKAKQVGNKSSSETLVERAKQYVRLNLHSYPTLQGAADQLQVHSAYLSKIYKEVSGENFSDYTHRLKMEHAVYLLVHTNQRIIKIAECLGYSDSSYFIKVFKKYFKKTPQEFRNR